MTTRTNPVKFMSVYVTSEIHIFQTIRPVSNHRDNVRIFNSQIDILQLKIWKIWLSFGNFEPEKHYSKDSKYLKKKQYLALYVETGGETLAKRYKQAY